MSDLEDFLKIYNIYRDHVKHEDDLLNQRLSFLIASQSILFLPYFRIIKEFIISGYNKDYDLFLLFLLLSLICFLGVFINCLTKDSIQGYVDASASINQKWKTELKNLNHQIKTKGYDPEKKEDIEIDNLTNSTNLAFLTLEFSDRNKTILKTIPNIRYENNNSKLNKNIIVFRDNMPYWLEKVWGVLWLSSLVFLVMQIYCQN